MEHTTARIKELEKQNQELTLTCQLWIAANDAKDEQIKQLQQQLSQLLLKVTRQNRQTRHQRPDTEARVIQLGQR